MAYDDNPIPLSVIHRLYSPRMRLILFLTLTLITFSYDQHDNYDYIMHYYEQNSQYPIVHTYYDRHFSNSLHFEDYTNVVEQTEYRNKDHAKFLFTNCEEIATGQSQVCDDMRRTKDNHAIVGYFPSGEFINYADKKMQNPPRSRMFRHHSDTYQVQQFERFLAQITPNFYEPINNYEQFEQWLLPRYSPNLIFATRQDDVPLVIAQLGVHYFLRFDMGYLHDLTQDVVQHLNITSFPALLILRYNFEESRDFSTDSYEDIKAYLETFALKQPRNDVLFHKMKPPKHQEIIKTDSAFELSELLDRSNGWAFVSQYKDEPQKLLQLKQKYGDFFQYYHFLNSSQQTQHLNLYDPQNKSPSPLPTYDIQWRHLNKEEFVSNTSAFLNKDFVVMGVRQAYSHFCTLALSTFFRGLTHCFILKEEDYEATSEQIKMKFDYGFVAYQKDVNGTSRVSGNNFNSDVYEEVFMTAEYQTRLKSKLVIDSFFDVPIKPIQGTDKLAQICAFPHKKCALLFTDPKKQDRTAYEYLKEVAKNFINEYQFFQIDISCNSHFKDEISSLRKNTNGLVVYHPRQDSYLHLKAKLSRSTFERFLKANLGDYKKLPLKTWKTPNILVHSCKAKSQGQEETMEARSTEGDKVEDLVDL